jgi:hypothetical protein
MRKSKNIISAVTVCVDYSDYLKKILTNKQQVDRWLIVTHISDKKTINLCKDNNLEFILSKDIYSNKSPFAKGKAINEGLKYLKSKNWILQIDSDILLPTNFKNYIDEIDLDFETIYGAKRVDSLSNVIEEVTPRGNPVIGDIIGFFQLWHSSKFSDYVDKSKTASEDDSEHFRRFTKSKVFDLSVVDVSNERCVHHDGRGALGKRRYLLYV